MTRQQALKINLRRTTNLKEQILKTLTFAFLFAITAIIASAAPQPNLSVQPWVAPATVTVNSTYQYTASVRNIGTQTAQNVSLTIEFPLTNTSPNRHILGKVTGYPSNCSIVSNKLVCNFGNVKHNLNPTRTVSFNFEYPVSTKPLELIARAATTSTNEMNPANNVLGYAPTVTHPDLPVTSANVVVSHCTGTNLTSFFECEKYPSSIASFTMTLDQGGSITLPYPGYFGNWNQNISPKQLYFNVTDGSDGVTFNGFASNSTCFEGVATFTPASNYVSPYKVCIQ